ncbi:unnamed protein product [Diplocarpon coronariae]
MITALAIAAPHPRRERRAPRCQAEIRAPRPMPGSPDAEPRRNVPPAAIISTWLRRDAPNLGIPNANPPGAGGIGEAANRGGAERGCGRAHTWPRPQRAEMPGGPEPTRRGGFDSRVSGGAGVLLGTWMARDLGGTLDLVACSDGLV